MDIEFIIKQCCLIVRFLRWGLMTIFYIAVFCNIVEMSVEKHQMNMIGMNDEKTAIELHFRFCSLLVENKNGDTDDMKQNYRQNVCLVIHGSLFYNSSLEKLRKDKMDPSTEITFIAVILNQTPNSRHSVYYATLFALYSVKLHAAFINVVDYILQRYIQKAPVFYRKLMFQIMGYHQRFVHTSIAQLLKQLFFDVINYGFCFILLTMSLAFLHNNAILPFTFVCAHPFFTRVSMSRLSHRTFTLHEVQQLVGASRDADTESSEIGDVASVSDFEAEHGSDELLEVESDNEVFLNTSDESGDADSSSEEAAPDSELENEYTSPNGIRWQRRPFAVKT
ncbi:hypothetical protein T10_1714 [Trichinella papuae]|uniref:Uncharacterized protein n=1 Tax=Trichinella papuae TaxID=268474 RepID=A0A0V1MDG8_9BILA|nr:hypothetical protein T10_1714 [Trichinella papuae]